MKFAQVIVKVTNFLLFGLNSVTILILTVTQYKKFLTKTIGASNVMKSCLIVQHVERWKN